MAKPLSEMSTEELLALRESLVSGLGGLGDVDESMESVYDY